MASLRNPVGPLPSSIYWRRRLVALTVLAAVVALVCWMVFGGGGGKKAGAGKGKPGPAQSITPGPSSSSGSGGSSDGAPSGSPGRSASPSSSASAGSAPPVTVTGGGSGGSSSGGSGGSGSSGGTGSGSTGANTAATMSLPVCSASDLELSLGSTEQTYNATQWPVFQLEISNTSGTACRTDLGAESAVVVVSTSGNGHVWSSGDCPLNSSAQWYTVPASGGPITADFQWSRTTSAAGCTPGAGGAAADPGTYVVQVSLKGVTAEPSHQFRLAPFGS